MPADYCTCGKPKPTSRQDCYDCMVARETEEGLRCECGERKSKTADLCPSCEYD